MFLKLCIGLNRRGEIMSGKKMTFVIIGFVLICIILIFLSISTFFKNNPHQPNQKSISFNSLQFDRLNRKKDSISIKPIESFFLIDPLYK